MAESNHPYAPKHLNLPQYIENTQNDQSLFNILLSSIGILALFSHHRISDAIYEPSNFQAFTYTWLIIIGWKGLLLDTYYFLFYNELEADNSLFSQILKFIAKFNSTLLQRETNKSIIFKKFIFGTILSILSLYTAELIYNDSIQQYPLLLIISCIHFYSNFVEYMPQLSEKLPNTIRDPYYTCTFIAYTVSSMVFTLALAWDSYERLTEILEYFY